MEPKNLSLEEMEGIEGGNANFVCGAVLGSYGALVTYGIGLINPVIGLGFAMAYMLGSSYFCSKVK
ncbi:MAG: hypothetical protein ACLFQA_10780 [Bacteroidales bacterium]